MHNHVSTLLFLLFCYFAVSSPQEAAKEAKPSGGRYGAMVAVETEDDDASVEEEAAEASSKKVTVDIDGEQDPSMEVFYPTKDWQTVKPGQSIPKGLHVRMNFETKMTEAKLMEGDDGMKYWKKGDREGIVNTKQKSFTRDELKEALKEFKAKRDDVQDVKIKEEALKKKFKSYEELKQDLKTMNLNVETDNEIITKLLELYKNDSISVDLRKNILSDLEYYLHQIDNAVDFSVMGGLDLVVKDLNHTDPQIRSEAAFVIGAAVQSNPRVQVKAIEAGAMQQLIRMLSIEKDLALRSRVLYALSCLQRHFPYAQTKFLKLGGMAVLTSLFTQPGTEKLQVKAISLTHDVLLEQQDVMQKSDLKDPHEKEKLRQYKSVHLREAMIEQGWCNYIPNLLVAQDHDTREKVLNAMELVLHNCKPNFAKSVGTLQQLKVEYEQLSYDERKEGDDDYFQKLVANLTNIISGLQSVNGAHRDEL
ncbi:nucleotide exchange factor SIL1-like isoform X2 [Lineus longissimus]|uniref:nucleotide exchange factor SIL1-like isoform X2 n=1 Tax=Lineus longissimus TaxID=88925 RepID=UPI00315D975E